MITRHVTQEDMSRYSGPGNIHSDVESAKRAGLDAPIAQGMMTLAYASELMNQLAGRDWTVRGELDVKFTAPVYAGDTITAEAEADGTGWNVRATNQDGALVMVGRAAMKAG